MENVLQTSVEFLTTIPIVLIGQELSFLLQTKTHNQRVLEFKFLYTPQINALLKNIIVIPPSSPSPSTPLHPRPLCTPFRPFLLGGGKGREGGGKGRGGGGREGGDHCTAAPPRWGDFVPPPSGGWCDGSPPVPSPLPFPPPKKGEKGEGEEGDGGGGGGGGGGGTLMFFKRALI